MTTPGPKIACVGTGWIGRHRMECVVESGAADVVAVCDPNDEARQAGLKTAPTAESVGSLEDVLRCDEVDGIMIATPSALHAEQTIAALGADKAVFCQKPLGRNADETARVVEAARRVDRLLGVDFSYRTTEAMRRIRGLVAGGELGRIYAAELAFHNAYGPDKAWFYDRERAGGGCLVDLGIHLVDLALWTLGWPSVERVRGCCVGEGQRLDPGAAAVEDYASAIVECEGGAVVDIACSWRLPAGRDAVIEAAFFGTEGGARMRNVDGSFYDFVAERYDGTVTDTLCEPPDAWGGRAAVRWAEQLGRDAGFDSDIARVVEVARVVDGIYGGA